MWKISPHVVAAMRNASGASRKGGPHGTNLHSHHNFDCPTNNDSHEHVGKPAAAAMWPTSLVGSPHLVLLVYYHLGPGRRFRNHNYSSADHYGRLHDCHFRRWLVRNDWRHCNRCVLSNVQRRRLDQSLVLNARIHNLCECGPLDNDTRFFRLYIHLSLLER